MKVAQKSGPPGQPTGTTARLGPAASQGGSREPALQPARPGLWPLAVVTYGQWAVGEAGCGGEGRLRGVWEVCGKMKGLWRLEAR